MKTEIERLSVQVTVLSERMDARFEAVDGRFDAVEGRLGRLEDLFLQLKKEIADGHAVLLSAILKLGPR